MNDRLPAVKRDDADAILTGAACAGAELADLAALAVEMYQRSRPDGPDEDGGFGGRAVWLGVTLGGAGRLDGDLTPGCAAALSAVLDSLGKKAGPEDIRVAAITGGMYAMLADRLPESKRAKAWSTSSARITK